MGLRRLAVSMIFLSVLSVGAGIASWSIMKPTMQWLQNGYAECLWSSTYRVPPEIVPDRSLVGPSGLTSYIISPRWDSSHASCGTQGNEVIFDYTDQTKRLIAKLQTGSDPGARDYPVPPFFLMAPFLNGVGVAMFLLGCIFAFVASAPVSRLNTSPTYGINKWNALIQYDPDIKRVVDALAPFGQKYVDEFAQAFMAIDDKNYLPQIIEKILATAKADAAHSMVEDVLRTPSKI